MLSIRKISSLDASEYGRYLAGQDRRLSNDAEGVSLERSDYYLGAATALVDSEQQVGGASWLGTERDRAEWGMQGEIDAVKLARLMRGEHAQEMALHVLDTERNRWVAVPEGTDLATLEGRETEMRPRGVRVGGYSLDPSSIREAIDTAVAARGGLDRLDADTRHAVLSALEGELVNDEGVRYGAKIDAFARGNDTLIKRLAEPLEAAGLVTLGEHRVQIVNSQDLTFSAPKSVSLAWAAADARSRALIEEAVIASSQRTMEYLAASTGCVKVKRNGRTEYEGAAGVVGASFIHHSSRGIGDRRPDPQLHVHTLVVGVRRQDGKMVTPDQSELVKHGREGGAYFRNELAHRLRELGLAVEAGTGKGERYFELAGFDRETIERFSGRWAAVDQWRQEYKQQHGRLPSQAEEDRFVIASRRIKSADTTEQLSREWRRELAPLGYDNLSIQRMFSLRNVPGEVVDPKELANLERTILARMEASGSMVRDREVRCIALEASCGRLNPEQASDLVRSMQERGRIVALQDGFVTTAELRTTEQMIVDSLDRQIASKPIRDRDVAKAIRSIEKSKGFALSDEQVRAIHTGCANAPVTAIVGLAGSGKGVAISGISDATRRSGYGIVAVSTQGVRALGAGEQAGANGMSIEQLIARHDAGWLKVTVGEGRATKERRGLERGDVILVDEAGMVDTHRYAKLVRIAEETGARIVLVGDPKQLAPIGAGGMFEQLLDRVPKAELVEIHRTKVKWLQEAQTAIRDGKAEHAIALMREHGNLHLANNRHQAIDRMVKEWNTWRQDHALGQSLMIVHTSNKDVDTVNELAQLARIRSGELESKSIKAPDRQYHFHAGEPVIFRDGAYKIDDRDRVENGTRGIIESVDPRSGTLVVRVDEPMKEPRSVVVDVSRLGDGTPVPDGQPKPASLRLMYASHVMPSQGETIERTAELTGEWSTSKEASYVGASRLQHNHQMYTSRDMLGTGISDEERFEVLAQRMNEIAAKGASLTREEQRGRKIARQAASTPYDDALRRYEVARNDPSVSQEVRDRLVRRVVERSLEHPPSVVRHTLGGRPTEPEQRKVWDEAARSIVEFRTTERFNDPRMPLPKSMPGASLETRQKLGATTSKVERAQHQLQEAKPELRLTHQVGRAAPARSRDLQR